MHKLMPLMMFMGLAASFPSPTPAHAQAPRTWVSRTGNDGNPCSTTAPCRTFAGAIAKTLVNGEINCVDAGGFDMVTITKSITIDCHDVFASILDAGANGINILFDNFAATDTRKTVRLRNLNINGLAAGLIGINITGATNAANSAVFIEDCLVDGMSAGAKRGISDTRAAGDLSIANTTVRNIGAAAIVIAPVDNSRRLEATLDGVRAQNAELGIVIGRPARVLIHRSLLSGHRASGIEADDGVEVHVDHSTITNNRAGVRAGAGAVIRLSNNNIVFNRVGIAGPTTSFGNNRIAGNTTAGTAPTAAGAISTEFGQQ
jgi:hypothetical protein